MNQNQKVILEPTAAMALIMGKGIYEGNELISNYLGKIDLSSGVALADRLKSTNRHTEELMCNRKFCYHEYISSFVKSNQANSQVIILGVGYDPISVYLLEKESDLIDSIIEIDMSDFEAKKTIFETINVPHMKKIKFVQADVTTDQAVEIVRRYGYDDRKPTVITMEGMMYYLSEDHFIDLIQSFRSPNKSNFFCVDYIFPWEKAPTEELRMEHKMGTEAVERQSKAKLTYYSAEKIADLIQSLGGVSIKVSTMKDVELKRTSRNHYFNREGEGIFEFITFNI